MNKITAILLTSSATLLLTACGGGGGSTPVEPNTNQYDLRTFIDTVAYTINGEGTITAPAGTIAVTGTFKSVYNNTGVVNGVTAHLHDVTLILSGGGTTVTSDIESATYMGNIIYTNNITENRVCETVLAPSTLTPIPIDAQVGYISDVVALTCSDGNYVTNLLKLNDAGGGNAELSIISNTYESQGGALVSSETDSIIVTPTMSMLNANITGSIPADGITFALYSTSITQP